MKRIIFLWVLLAFHFNFDETVAQSTLPVVTDYVIMAGTVVIGGQPVQWTNALSNTYQFNIIQQALCDSVDRAMKSISYAPLHCQITMIGEVRGNQQNTFARTNVMLNESQTVDLYAVKQAMINIGSSAQSTGFSSDVIVYAGDKSTDFGSRLTTSYATTLWIAFFILSVMY